MDLCVYFKKYIAFKFWRHLSSAVTTPPPTVVLVVVSLVFFRLFAASAVDRHGVLCAGWLNDRANRRCPSVLTSNVRYPGCPPSSSPLTSARVRITLWSTNVPERARRWRSRQFFLWQSTSHQIPDTVGRRFAFVKYIYIYILKYPFNMRASTKLSLCALFCLATALAVSAEIYFEENFPDGMYCCFLLPTFDKPAADNC